MQLSFDGKLFFGWQRQPNAISVQQTIEDAFLLLFKEKLEIVGCGRTDTGVHAKKYFCHFDSDYNFDNNSLYSLNRYLPSSIFINSIIPCEDDFHARFSAKTRTYNYFIINEKNPFYREYSYFVPQKLNIDLMQEAANLLQKYNDFTSFSKLHTDVKTNNCIIYSSVFVVENSYIKFEITATRFLRNMVRAIVGTLIEVGKGKISVEDFADIIERKNRQDAGQSVPANALFLTDVTY